MRKKVGKRKRKGEVRKARVFVKKNDKKQSNKQTNKKRKEKEPKELETCCDGVHCC